MYLLKMTVCFSQLPDTLNLQDSESEVEGKISFYGFFLIVTNGV